MSVIVKYIIVFFVSMVPLIELRGAIPIAVGLGLNKLILSSSNIYQKSKLY